LPDIQFFILGQPPRKSNSRRIVYGGNVPRLIKSTEALQWVSDAIYQVPGDARQGLGSAEKPVEVILHIYYKTKHPDLSGELVLDMLEEAGVLSNDRHVYHWEMWKHFSKDKPGVQVTVRGM
jgi:Holliday junction resolvase RusA-like endonuclease